ncbi:MAG: HupE/UreJ family protein, partial [Novosphingobium sp.]
VLLIGRLGAVVKAATAFTVAHSLTLIGSTLGLVGLAQAPVEALIALSIVFLAVEIVKRDPGRPSLTEQKPWLVAFLFGLIHGFGFAGALREIGLPESEVPTALLTFNLGVEVGQLMIIATALMLIALVSRLRPQSLRPATVIATYAIGTIASFWLIERVWA